MKVKFVRCSIKIKINIKRNEKLKARKTGP